jgi:hypothetical protein
MSDEAVKSASDKNVPLINTPEITVIQEANRGRHIRPGEKPRHRIR